MHAHGWLAFTLLGPALVLGATTATSSAAAPTCQGESATIVGSSGKDDGVAGTEGVDVIVTNGASSVSGLGGDDLICVTGRTDDGKRVVVQAGEGRDHVTTDTKVTVIAYLGLGHDRFQGGAELDLVYDGERNVTDEVGRDVIRTAAGNDTVFVSGAHDRILAGADNDTLHVSSATSKTFIDGGFGTNTLDLQVEDLVPGSWILNNRTNVLTRDGVKVASWNGITRFETGFPGELTVKGSRRDEYFGATGSEHTRVDAGDGDDEIHLFRPYDAPMGNIDTINGGSGSDTLSIEAYPYPSVEAHIQVELVTHTVDFEQNGETEVFTVPGIENVVTFQIPDVELIGNDERNELTVYAPGYEPMPLESCRIRIVGNGGDDRLAVRPDYIRYPGPQDTCPHPMLLGDGGDDVLLGSWVRDTLKGGSGRDRAVGGKGNDRCLAEITSSCERVSRLS